MTRSGKVLSLSAMLERRRAAVAAAEHLSTLRASVGARVVVREGEQAGVVGELIEVCACACAHAVVRFEVADPVAHLHELTTRADAVELLAAASGPEVA